MSEQGAPKEETLHIEQQEENLSLRKAFFNELKHKSENEIAEALIRSDSTWFVRWNLHLFHKLSGLVAESIIKEGYGREVLYNLENFKMDENEIAKIFVDNNQYIQTFIANLYCFKNLRFETIKSLVDSYARELAQNVEHLSAQDHNLLAHALIESKHSLCIVDYLEKFVGLDNEVAKHLLTKGMHEHIIDYLDSFLTLDDDVLEKACLGTSFNDPKYRRNIKNRFGLSNMFCLVKDLKGRPFSVQFLHEDDREMVNQVLNEALKDQNWFEAFTLLEIADYHRLDLGLSDEEKQIIREKGEKEEQTRKNKEPKREVYEQVSLSKELVTFYSLSFIEGDLNRFKQSLKTAHEKDQAVSVQEKDVQKQIFGQELSFKDKVEMRDIEAIIQMRVKKIYEWMRIYLVKAVTSELGHQDQVISQTKLVIPKNYIDTEDFVSKGTEEEIRIYLHSAQTIFSMDGWTASFGGDAWANIASHAERLWKPINTSDMIYEIDRVLDLEHNSGMVFDKDEKVKVNKDREKKLLDLKFKAVDFDDLIKKFQTEVNDPALYQQITILHDRVQCLKQSPTNILLGGD